MARGYCPVRGREEGEKKIKTNRKVLLAFVFKGNSPPVCILPGKLFLNQHLQAKSDAVACCGSTGMGYSGRTLVSCSFMIGHLSSGREASCQMFPDSLLRYCCLTGLFLDQVGFSTGYLKNICLMLEDKSPTRQKNPLAPGFFGEWGRMGWGRLGLQVKQKRGSGLLRLWSRVEDSFG